MAPAVLHGTDSDVHAGKHIFLDLENLAFLATSLQHLRLRYQYMGVELRAYTSPEHQWAD